MLSRNCAEKLSGPWVFFVGFMFFLFFLAPLLRWQKGVFVYFVYFFGAPCREAKNVFIIFLVCQAISLAWVFFLRIFLCMWGRCIHMRGFLNLFFLNDIM